MDRVDLAFAGIAAQARLLRDREITSRELVELYLERLEDSRARILGAGVIDLPPTATTGQAAPR